MFSFLAKEDRLALRLPKEEHERFLEEYQAELVVQHDRVMKEYVEVSDALLRDTDQLATCFEVSCAYVESLKPKPTKRRA
jgi:TfoX/Sxy family transcriptional regulator of competence genes